MSKRSLFWGQGSGKLGEAVYYRAGGEQRTRTYVKTVKNPKSYLQAVQRTKFNNMVGAYKALEMAVKSFYTSRAANQSAFNAFFKINWPLNLWVSDKETISFKEGTLDGFYVSRGQVSVPTQLSRGDWQDDESETHYGLTMVINSTNIVLPQGDNHQRYLNDGKKLYQAFVGETNPYNLPAEFNVTVIKVEQGYVASNASIFTVKCSADSTDTWRVVSFPPKSSAPDPSDMERLVEAVDGDITPATSSQGSIEGVTKLAIGGDADTEDTVTFGAAIVISYKDASGKQTTNSPILCGAGMDEYMNSYKPDGEAGAQIVSQYEQISNLIE